MPPSALLVTDLDGTLLRSDHSLDADTRAALERAGRAGVTRAVATGRSLLSARRVLPPDAPIDYLVFSSGAAAVAWGAKAGARLGGAEEQLDRVGVQTRVSPFFDGPRSFGAFRAAPRSLNGGLPFLRRAERPEKRRPSRSSAEKGRNPSQTECDSRARPENNPQEYSMYFEELFEDASRERARLGGEATELVFRAPLLFGHTLAPEAVARALAFATGRGLDVMVHAPPPDSHRFGYLTSGRGHPDLQRRLDAYHGHCWVLDGAAPAWGWRGAACQVLAIADSDDPASLVAEARRDLHGLQVIRTTSPLDHRSLWLEIFTARASKGQAAQWLAHHLQVPRERTFAAGNDYNDADLLDWAHTAAVVDNAPAELKHGRHVLPGHDAGGVAALIERFVLA